MIIIVAGRGKENETIIRHSAKAGITFPVARIRRLLKKGTVSYRIKSSNKLHSRVYCNC